MHTNLINTWKSSAFKSIFQCIGMYILGLNNVVFSQSFFRLSDQWLMRSPFQLLRQKWELIYFNLMFWDEDRIFSLSILCLRQGFDIRKSEIIFCMRNDHKEKWDREKIEKVGQSPLILNSTDRHPRKRNSKRKKKIIRNSTEKEFKKGKENSKKWNMEEKIKIQHTAGWSKGTVNCNFSLTDLKHKNFV